MGARQALLLPALLLMLLWVAMRAAHAGVAAIGDCDTPLPLAKPPGELVERGVNESTRALIVHLHNAKRNAVAAGSEERGLPGPQPSAANMPTLRWDEELANRAQHWADRRVFQHNPCKTTKKFPYVGENLALQLAYGKLPELFGWEKAVDDWYDEVKDWPKSLVTKFRFIPSTGHYTQLIWANTTKVGCGFCSYKDGKFTYYLHVCNYAPGGNVIGTPMYEEGVPRSGCRQSSKDRRYPALCVL